MAAIGKNARLCETCGSTIDESSGDLGCMICLLDAGLDGAAEQIDELCASPPDEVGVYTIERRVDGSFWELGHGAMGVTYLAIDKLLDRPVALKIINSNLGSRSAEARERFMREARAAAALRHPNVATVYQFGIREGTGQFFYAMELVDGETLEERVRRLGPLDVLTTIDIALQVTAALEAAEERGLVHRDLKPGNLMLVSPGDEKKSASTSRHGRDYNKERQVVATALRRRVRRDTGGTDEANQKLTVKVIDFGVAKAVAEKTNAMAITHGGFVGTPAFASPEQFTNTPVDVRSDIYSLGATLWFLLTGHMLFSGRTVEEIQEARRSKPLPIEQLKAARVPHRFISLLTSMLAIEPAARPAGASELGKKLQKIHASVTGRGKTVARVALAAAIIAVATTVAVREFQLTKVKPATIPEKSVAVLPFENLSDDPNSAYFAEGIQEEILTRLASIAELKVISRNSTQRYHSKPGNLTEVAKQLGVANILEGSVQKAAGEVRVNIQLINAQTDSHLWAETYDRKLTDILGVESEIAKRIAESLQAKLSGREEQALAVKPTNNPEAYDAYLRGLAFEARSYQPFQIRDNVGKAVVFYERAVQFDPSFAVAWARLSRADAQIYFDRMDSTTAARGDAAKRALENAQRLEPNSPETLLALGYYAYRVLTDYGAAKATFGRVSKMLPSNSEVPYALALVTRREGHWDQSLAYFDRALALDPRNSEIIMDAAATYAVLRQFPTALKLYDRVLDITPNDPNVMATKASVYQALGDLQEAARSLPEINERTPSGEAFYVKLTQLRLQRNYGEVIRLLQTRQAQFHFDSPHDKGFEQVWLALMQRLAGDTAVATATAEQARITLEQLNKDQPQLYAAPPLSQAYAVIGEKDSALKTAEYAIALLPSAKDRVDGPPLEENLAFIQTILGENSRAISILGHLLQTPSSSWFYGPGPITQAILRLDPFWDPLRGDPAFQELCKDKTDKSVAVLPFENLSRDPDNAYFAEGIQEEILTRFAKIADLKVVSRASTERYQNKPRDLAEIAKQLGVANILEGSVQKAGNQVRVNVQLINAQTDSHIWAETYDRKSADILGVESEIAKAIATALHAKLTGRDEQALAVKPTNNPEAYDAYLRGLAFDARSYQPSQGRNNLGKAASFYERAVQLDPNFAMAWARLSRADALLYFNRIDTTTAARGEAAKRALETAQKLDPNSPETLLALGHYEYRVPRDYGAAKATFERVGKMLPGSSQVPWALGAIARREGLWDESIAYFEQAVALDPRNMELLVDAAQTYAVLRQFSAALKLYDRVLDISPNDADVMAEKARSYQDTGNLEVAARYLTGINQEAPSEEAFYIKITQLRLQRNYGEAIQLLRARQAQFHFDSQYDKGFEQVWLALMLRLAGDTAGATATGKQARNTLEKLSTDQPQVSTAILLSEAYAVMGEKESALKIAEEAMALLPDAKDRVEGPPLEENMAFIQTVVGENSRAISILSKLLQQPSSSWFYGPGPVTSTLLRLDPFWDPLRGDPAFQKLCEEKQPPAAP